MSRDERRGAWATFRDVIALLFAAGTGASTLGGWTAGTTQTILHFIGITLTIYLICIFWFYYRLSLRRDRMSAKELIRDIDDVVTRQSASHDESVHVTIVIGKSDDEDCVREEVRVTPNSQVVHRMIRPIMPFHWPSPRRLSDIAFSCQVDDSDDGPVLVRARPILNQPYLRIWLIFSPALTKPTVWRFQYRPRGLWRDLREKNLDRLVWRDITPAAGRSPLTDFRITFVFVDEHFRPGVSEANSRGTVTPATRSESGQWVVTWHDRNPRGHVYEWTVTRQAFEGPG